MPSSQTLPLQSCLFEGRVRHRRFTPIENSFTYSGFWAYLDLAELDRVFASRWFWSTSRAALARFERRDHLLFPDDVTPLVGHESLPSQGHCPVRADASMPPLDESIRGLVLSATGAAIKGPIRLLTQLRMWGYLMNPVSFYYCFNEDGTQTDVVVAEVNNTPWGERHCYVLDRRTSAGERLRFEHAKQFHVSPFMNLEMDYRWGLTSPDSTLTVHIENWRVTERLFDCTLHLKRREINAGELARMLLRHPFMTGKVTAGIYWQALRLWWKRCPFVPHPNSAVSNS